MSSVGTAVRRPADWLQLFCERVRRRPDAPALESADLVLSYAELDAWAADIAAGLRGPLRGETPLVGVYVDRGPLAIAAILGILKAGLAYLALDPRYPRERIEYMAADAELALIVSDGSRAVPAPPHTAVVSLAAYDADQLGEPVPRPPTPERAELAYVVYTSGSTGRPKGSMITHTGLANMAVAQRRVFGLGERDRVLQFSSLSFDASTFELVLALGAGACLCLADAAALQPGPPLLSTLRERCISALVIPPSALAKVPHEPLPDLKTIAVAGEPCPPNLVEAWGRGRRFFNLYGPSEATIWTTEALCAPGDPQPPIGRAIEGVAVHVLDTAFEPVDEGEVGELHIGGAGVGRGYLKRVRLTAERFIPDRFGLAGERLYRTGDLVRVGPGGSLVFVGRRDRQVKVRGFRIDLGEVESALLRAGPIRAAAVAQDPEDSRLVGYLVPADGDALDIPELRDLVRRELPEHMVPGRFIPVPAIPLDPNGKADLRSLPALARRDLASGVACVPPNTAVERVVAETMAVALRFDIVGIDDDFFKLGGDSLQAPGVIAELEAVFGCRLFFESFVRRPTPRAIAASIAGAAGADAEETAGAWLRRRRARPEPAGDASAGRSENEREDRMESAGASDESTYVAVRSCHGHYSIWPAGREIPQGWAQIGEAGSREECLDLVEAAWEDPVLGFQPAAGG